MIKTGLILPWICAAPMMFDVCAHAFNLPDSGQTMCYQAVSPYAAIDCPGTGQDGAYSNDAMRYTDNSDGTVTDKNTGLMWQKCSVGQDHLTCSGDNTIWDWYWATGTPNPPEVFDDVCGDLTLGGYTNWRLPTKKELITLVHYGIAGTTDVPMINASMFPETRAFYYWSATAFASSPDYAWDVRFNAGTSRCPPKVSYRSVRCVRGEQVDQSLTADGVETVTDTSTGLVWQKAEAEEGAMTWEAALSYCEGRTLAGQNDWRLPNIRELDFLGDDTRDNPAINTAYFPNPYAGYYWSSTTPQGYADKAWIKDFSDGEIYHGLKSESNYVRCVRGGYAFIEGDINNDAHVDLADALTALQMLTKKEPSRPIHKQADVNGDRSIGLPDVLFILQRISELR